MKRYDIILETSIGSNDLTRHHVESNTGEWVKFEDVAGMQKLRLGQVNCGACGSDLSKGNHSTDCYLVKCNCAEMSKDFMEDGLISDFPAEPWICPAHGYKRI